MTTTMANLDTLGSLITAYFTVANDDWRAGFLKAATPPNGVTPQNNANGELAAHLADLKKSEALGQPRRPEFANNLEQLNSVQGDILNRLRTLPASLASDDTWVKRLAWHILLIGFLLGTLIESRKENEQLSSVIGSLPSSMQAPALLQSHGGGLA